MSSYTCPLCEAVGPEPCQDVADFAIGPVLRRDGGESPLRDFVEEWAHGEVARILSCFVPFLVEQAAWPAALAEAHEHVAQGCPDPMECDECLPALSVLQVDAYFWATREAALTGS